MAELGAQVAIGYHGNQKGADQVRDRIGGAGGQGDHGARGRPAIR